MDRIISEEWSDDEYNVELEHDEYRVWDLIVKNTNRIGIAKVPKSLMCWRAKRLDRKRYDEIIAKLVKDGKLIVNNRYYIIVNHYKHWDYSRPTGAKGALNDLLAVLNEITHTQPTINVVQNLCKRIEQQSANNKNVEEISTLVEQVLNSCSMVVEQHERERERERETKEKDIPPNPPSPIEAPEITEIRKIITRIRNDAVGIKMVCNLTNEQIEKLVEKYSVDKLTIMLPIYYNWKMAKQIKRNDYLTIINGWVEEEANKRQASKPPTPVKRDDLPDGWDTWSTEQKREYNLRRAK